MTKPTTPEHLAAAEFQRARLAAAARHRRSWVEVDLAALVRNAARLHRLLPEGCRIIANVKKQAYGHGMREVADAAMGWKFCAGVAVVSADEALVLRDAGFAGPILLYTPPRADLIESRELEALVEEDVRLTVTSLAEARTVARAAETVGRAAVVDLKIDTGMGRLGYLPDEVAGEIEAIRGLKHLELASLYTHLAAAGEKPETARAQLERLERLRMQAGLMDLPVHLGGSDIVGLPELIPPRAQIRLGIGLFGDLAGVDELEPVMTFKTRVIYRRRAPAGTTIGYGMTYTTTHESELAVIGAGYGNGLLRAMSPADRDPGAPPGEVLIRGRRCPMRGRVCMDQVVVEVTDCPETRVGDEVVLFGRQTGPDGAETVLPAAEAAKKAATISYELVTLAGQLNPREYV